MNYLYDLLKEEQRMYLKINEIIAIDKSKKDKKPLRMVIDFYEIVCFMIIKGKINKHVALELFKYNMIDAYNKYKDDVRKQTYFRKVMEEQGY